MYNTRKLFLEVTNQTFLCVKFAYFYYQNALQINFPMSTMECQIQNLKHSTSSRLFLESGSIPGFSRSLVPMVIMHLIIKQLLTHAYAHTPQYPHTHTRTLTRLPSMRIGWIDETASQTLLSSPLLSSCETQYFSPIYSIYNASSSEFWYLELLRSMYRVVNNGSQ
jgi:hypothetical protein